VEMLYFHYTKIAIQMDKQYDSLFDDRDDEDKRYHHLIPTLEAKVLSDVLEEDLNIINNSKLTVAEWTKFKFEMLKCEKEWKLAVFSWIPDLTNKYPYIGISIKWDSLENRSTRYFQIHMCFENVWSGKDALFNVWEAIDNASD
jgi:hypothetical protein